MGQETDDGYKSLICEAAKELEEFQNSIGVTKEEIFSRGESKIRSWLQGLFIVFDDIVANKLVAAETEAKIKTFLHDYNGRTLQRQLSIEDVAKAQALIRDVFGELNSTN